MGEQEFAPGFAPEDVLSLQAENTDLRSKLKAAEDEAERIMAANDVPEMYGVGQRHAAERILTILSEPANAEGIASEPTDPMDTRLAYQEGARAGRLEAYAQVGASPTGAGVEALRRLNAPEIGADREHPERFAIYFYDAGHEVLVAGGYESVTLAASAVDWIRADAVIKAEGVYPHGSDS